MAAGAAPIAAAAVAPVATPAAAPRPVPAMGDILPPIIVLILQIAVGVLIGANPVVLGAAAAAIVLAAYLVQAAKRTRTLAAPQGHAIPQPRVRQSSVEISPSSVATFEGGPLRASAPDSVPMSAEPRPSADVPAAPVVARVQRLDNTKPSEPPVSETPGGDGQPEHHPDLDWLWGTILPDASARPNRRNDN